MRWSFLVLLLLVGTAAAKPKIAIAPIDGDKDNEIGELIVEVAADHGRAIDPGRVGKEMEKLNVESLQGKPGKKLRIKLEADALVYGKVSKKHLSLTIAGKSKSKVEIDYKTKKDLKKSLAAKLGKQLDVALEDKGEKDEDDEEEAKPFGDEGKKADEDKKDREDEAKKKDRDEEDRKKKDREDEDKRSSKKDADKKKDREDEDRRGKKRTARRGEDEEDDRRADEDEQDEDRPRKKRKKQKRHPITQAAVWVDAGAAFARRTLTYQANGMTKPPRVGTGAAAAAVEGELYPASFSSLKGPAAGIGIAGAYERTVGLGIAVPKTTVVAPITQGAYWIGARYRFVFGSSSVAVGASYWRRYYMADRSKLMMAGQLDMPDVNYTALAPDLTARFALSPKLAVYGAFQFPLMLSSGPIQEPTSYGPSTIIAFDIRAGVQLALGAHYAVQVGLGFDQIGFKFNAKMGSQAALRDVSAATDRSIGLAATLGVFY